jgi:hypothetical protein
VTEETTSGAARSQGRADADADESSEPAQTRDDGRPAATERARAATRSRARARSHTGERVSATSAARRAAEAVAGLTGHDAETVISIEPSGDGWKIGVEVVETRRIPDSADILASYEVWLDSDGGLISNRRTHR